MSEEEKRNEVLEILKETPEPESKIVALIWDGKQFSIRIPREYASVLSLDKSKHKFKFKLTRPSPLDAKGVTTLTGEIVVENPV